MNKRMHYLLPLLVISIILFVFVVDPFAGFVGTIRPDSEKFVYHVAVYRLGSIRRHLGCLYPEIQLSARAVSDNRMYSPRYEMLSYGCNAALTRCDCTIRVSVEGLPPGDYQLKCAAEFTETEKYDEVTEISPMQHDFTARRRTIEVGELTMRVR